MVIITPCESGANGRTHRWPTRPRATQLDHPQGLRTIVRGISRHWCGDGPSSGRDKPDLAVLDAKEPSVALHSSARTAAKWSERWPCRAKSETNTEGMNWPERGLGSTWWHDLPTQTEAGDSERWITTCSGPSDSDALACELACFNAFALIVDYSGRIS